MNTCRDRARSSRSRRASTWRRTAAGSATAPCVTWRPAAPSSCRTPASAPTFPSGKGCWPSPTSRGPWRGRNGSPGTTRLTAAPRALSRKSHFDSDTRAVPLPRGSGDRVLSGGTGGRQRGGKNPTRRELVLTGAFLLALTAAFAGDRGPVVQAAVGRRDRPTVEPAAAGAGGEQETVFNHTEDACSPIDIPDAPARAFRDAEGQVHLIASHYVTRAMVGPSLDAVRHDCRRVMVSDLDGDPARFDDREWITAPYTRTAARSTRSSTTSTRAQPPRSVSIRGLPEVLVQLDHAGPVDRRGPHLHARRAAAPPGRVGAVPLRARCRPLRPVPAQQHRPRDRAAPRRASTTR